MEKKSEIREELKEWQSPLADMPRNMPHEVPENYFSELQGNIIAGLQAEQTPLEWSDSNPFALPQNYFNTLPQDILARAKQADAVPAKKRIAFRPFIRAAAAALMLALGVAGYQYFTTQQPDTQKQLASLTDETVSSYLSQYTDETDTELITSNLSPADISELESIGNDEIIDYLNETGWKANTN